jgi:hypothetical protein
MEFVMNELKKVRDALVLELKLLQENLRQIDEALFRLETPEKTVNARILVKKENTYQAPPSTKMEPISLPTSPVNKWSESDVNTLKEMTMRGCSNKEIAQALNRTVGAVSFRKSSMKISAPEKYAAENAVAPKPVNQKKSFGTKGNNFNNNVRAIMEQANKPFVDKAETYIDPQTGHTITRYPAGYALGASPSQKVGGKF